MAKNKINDETARLLLQEHQKGETLCGLAKASGFTHHTIRRAIQRVGGKTRGREESFYFRLSLLRKNAPKKAKCSVCKANKPSIGFYARKGGMPLLQDKCKECRQKYSRVYYRANRSKVLAREKELRWKFRLEAIKAYGGKCVCCGEQTPEFLTIDHVNGGGNKHREEVGGSKQLYKILSKKGWPKNEYRLLCYNCNCARGAFGFCPHERK
jgi:hypothetical protein